MTPKPHAHFKVARKAYQEATGDPWCLEPRTYSRWEAWLFLIQLAQWRAHTRQTKYGLVSLERGQFIASLRWLGERWGWSAMKVTRFLAEAQKAGRIARQTESHAGTVYLIVNYDTYQNTVAEGETDDETDRETDARQTRDKNKQEKQVKAKSKTPTESYTAPDLAAVLAHYATRHPRRSVSLKARRLVARVLESGWTVADCVAAIDGNADDAWHAEKRKHELEYVLRDDKRDGFREMGEQATALPSYYGRELDANGWMTDEFERATRPDGYQPWRKAS